MEDYAATNVYWKGAREKIAQGIVHAGTSALVTNTILVANPSYIETFFQTIDTKYGSINNFLKIELVLDTEKLNTLWNRILRLI